MNKRKAGGVTSLHVSTKNRREIKLKGKLNISLKMDRKANKEKKPRFGSSNEDSSPEKNCGWWDESSSSLMSGDCTVDSTTSTTDDILTCSCPHLTDFMSVISLP